MPDNQKEDNEIIDQEQLNHLKNLFQDCNINFLIGSGLSVPFFETLGSIELWLTQLEETYNKKEIDNNQYIYLKASLNLFIIHTKNHLKFL